MKQTTFKARRSQQRGISMVQIAVAILVTAIITLGGLGAFRYITGSAMNNDASDVSDLVAMTKQYTQTRGGYSALTAANITIPNLAGLQFFANTSGTGAGTTAYTTSGKQFTAVAPINVDTGAAASPNGIQFVATGYLTKECLDLIPKLGSLVSRIEIPAGTAVKTSSTQLDLTQLTTQCNAGADNVTIVLDIHG